MADGIPTFECNLSSNSLGPAAYDVSHCVLSIYLELNLVAPSMVLEGPLSRRDRSSARQYIGEILAIRKVLSQLCQRTLLCYHYLC